MKLWYIIQQQIFVNFGLVSTTELAPMYILKVWYYSNRSIFDYVE